MDFIVMHAERIGAVLVMAGLVVSMFLGTPQSKIPTGSWSIGETDERQLRIHNGLTWAGPSISALGCAAYVLAAFIR